LCRELGLGGELQAVTPPGGAFVLKGRRLYALPSPSVLGLPIGWRALLHYELLPLAARARLALEPRLPPRRGGGDESVASFFRRRFGRATVDLIAQPLLGGIHAGDIEQLSMQTLFPRLLELERTRGHVLELRRREAQRRSPFVAPASGMNAIVRALAGRLGDAIIVGARVERVERSGDAWHVLTRDSAPRLARAVVLAVPAYAAAAVLDSIDSEAARLCREIPYVSTAGVALAWPRADVPHPLNGTGFVVARKHSDVRITACTWVSSKWEHRAPPDQVLVRAFVGGAHDPSAVDLDDEKITGVVRRDLQRTLGISAAPSLARVYRWRRASVQHTVGERARVEAIDARLAAHPGLFVAGGGFRAVGIPDCIADARAVVERIVAAGSC
jgi:oxygen-dependent protoporphyrinogen oxidase